jgi:predicted DNA-binding protein
MVRRSGARALVRLPDKTYSTLKKLSKDTARPMSEVVAEAVERYRRERFLAEANAAYDALSPSAKRKYRQESAAWDATLLDGLGDEET